MLPFAKPRCALAFFIHARRSFVSGSSRLPVTGKIRMMRTPCTRTRSSSWSVAASGMRRIWPAGLPLSRLESAVDYKACYRLAVALVQLYLHERERDGIPERVVLDLDGTSSLLVLAAHE
jgi:hypothetical protein